MTGPEPDPPPQGRTGPGSGGGRIVPPEVEAEVRDELEFHIEMRVRQLVAEGWEEHDARAEAVSRFGDIDRVRSNMEHLGRGRDVKKQRRTWWHEFRQDVRFAVRQLARAPMFAGVAILTLALGIGASSAVFSVVNSVLLRPLPYAEPDRIATVWTRYLPPSGFDIPRAPLSAEEGLDLEESLTSVERLGLWTTGRSALTGPDAAAQQIVVGRFSDGVFDVLGVPAERGRTFTPNDDVPGAAPVTVLSHGLWATRYGGDPGLVGRSIYLDGVPTEVVGVMPETFAFPASADVWVPLGIDRSNAGNRASHWLQSVARLAPGRSFDALYAELELIASQWADAHEHNVGHFAMSDPLRTAVVGSAPRLLTLLGVAVGLVLLIACANVANLLLARGERRAAEFGVRSAVGAGRGRLLRQLLTESLVIGGAASIVGLALGAVGVRALVALDPSALPRLDGLTLDLRVVGFTVALAVATSFVFGTVPAILTARKARMTIATSSARSAGSRGRSGLRRGLVVAEVSLSVVVVVLAGLTLRSLTALTGTDPAFEPEGLLSVQLSLPAESYPDDELVPAHFATIEQRFDALPGVVDAVAASTLPFMGTVGSWDFTIPDRPQQDGEMARNARVTVVTPSFFETLGIDLFEGRTITDVDRADAALVSVVSRTMAEMWWPGESAIGKQWGYGSPGPDARWMTIVGVVEDQYASAVDEQMAPQVYLPYAQSGVSAYGYVPRAMRFALRTREEPMRLVDAVRAALAEFDPELPVSSVRVMDDLVQSSTAEPRIVATTLGSFGLIALLLAAVGVYGVIAYSVAGRGREIGVRMALGARRADVVRMILLEGTRPVALGLAVGVGLASLAVRGMDSMLFGVAATDPLTFAVVPVVLLAVGVGASLVPALRGTTTDPSDALSGE